MGKTHFLSLEHFRCQPDSFPAVRGVSVFLGLPCLRTSRLPSKAHSCVPPDAFAPVPEKGRAAGALMNPSPAQPPVCRGQRRPPHAIASPHAPILADSPHLPFTDTCPDGEDSGSGQWRGCHPSQPLLLPQAPQPGRSDQGAPWTPGAFIHHRALPF